MAWSRSFGNLVDITGCRTRALLSCTQVPIDGGAHDHHGHHWRRHQDEGRNDQLMYDDAGLQDGKVEQVVLRDRFAGTHTPTPAVDKAWTAASFKTSTSQLAEVTQGGKASSGIRDIARVLAVGGVMIDVAGDIYGAIGVSGAPNGEAGERCAKAGLDTIVEDLEL